LSARREIDEEIAGTIWWLKPLLTLVEEWNE